MNDICKICLYKKDCEIACPAYSELHRIATEQDQKDKTAIVRNLIRRLGIRDAEKNNDLRLLANKIMRKYPEFDFIKDWNIKIGYVVSQEKKSGEKVTYADCRKVPEVYRAYLPYDFVITFYERNTELLNENQKKILMLHELRHIGIGPRGIRVAPHDIEDFSSILERYGLNWDGPGEELPDILGGDT